MILHSLTTAAADFAAVLPFQIPNPDPIQPPGTQGFLAMMGWAKWVALAVTILGLIAAGAMMSFNSRRGEGGEHVGRVGMALVGVIIIAAATSLVGFLATA